MMPIERTYSSLKGRVVEAGFTTFFSKKRSSSILLMSERRIMRVCLSVCVVALVVSVADILFTFVSFGSSFLRRNGNNGKYERPPCLSFLYCALFLRFICFSLSLSLPSRA
ncbi:unnamed protein product, partial [Pylaiella littoralis]